MNWITAPSRSRQEARFSAFVENSKRATPDKWVWSDTGKATGGLGDGRLRWLEGKLKKAAKPLGVFCYSDYDATCVLNACLAAGLSVPEDVAILGVDDNEIICENQPVPLSSIRHDHGRVGYEAAALLQRLMKGGKAPSKPQLIAPVGITTRRSTDIIAAKDPILRDALAFIAENFMRPMSASKIAKARYLLTDTDTKVIAIASQTGFCNAPYLIRSFKKVFGASPSVWRRREAATRKGRAGF